MKKIADELVGECVDIINSLYGGNIDVEFSKETRDEYLRLGHLIVGRSNGVYGLTCALNNTVRPATFHKRFAAVRYYFYDLQMMYFSGFYTAEKSTKEDFNKAIDLLVYRLNLLREWMLKLAEAKRQGFIGKRIPRSSKRKALSGLPDTWREQLIERAKDGKYGLAILVCALTGCRPAELLQGVAIRREVDLQSRQAIIRFDIVGAKVKENQGQPSRSICYLANDPHPLVVALHQYLTQHLESVKIANTVNFTVEIRRLAKSLWPKHRHTITAYCLRHQWSADMKSGTGDGDMVSWGLGHCSAKTRRCYGVANQSDAAGSLQPFLIAAERPVKSFNTNHSYNALSPY